jgi:hypothetical protein
VVKYDFREFPGWATRVAEFEQVRRDDGATIILCGDCPRCHDSMDVELPIKAQTGGLAVTALLDNQLLLTTRRPPWRLGSQEPESKAFTKTAHCNCQMKHDERPDDVHEGCGAFGNLSVGE